MNLKEDNQYKDVVFARESFGENKKIYVKDITNNSKLFVLLYELNCHELSLTKEGLDFLENQYGLDNIVDMILKEIERGVDYKYSTKEEIKQWLINESSYG